MRTYLTLALRARRIELGLVLVVALLAALTWPVAVPNDLMRPDVPRDRLLVLVAALHAGIVPLAVRPLQGALERTALTSMAARRAAWTLVLVGVLVGSAWLASLVMVEEVSAAYLRNVVLLVGASLLLVPVHHALALAAPWLWVVGALVAGHDLTPGQAAGIRPWAVPIQAAPEGVAVAGVLLAVGALVYSLRGSRAVS